MAMTTLQWPDYLILVAFLAISLGIGFYHSVTGGRQKTIQEFIMANRKLGILPTALSLFVSFQSAIMMLGATVEMYMFGVQYLVWIPVSFTISTIFVERLFVPWIYPLKLVSINDVSVLKDEGLINNNQCVLLIVVINHAFDLGGQQ
jgi:Na+/proline symporter